MELVVDSLGNKFESRGWKIIEPLTLNIDNIRTNDEFMLKCKEHFIDYCVCPNCGNKLITVNENTFECEKCLREYKGLEDLYLDILILEERNIPTSLKGFDYSKPIFWDLFGKQGLTYCGFSIEIIEAFNSIYPINDVMITKDWFNVLSCSFLFESDYGSTYYMDEMLGRFCVDNDLLSFSIPEEAYNYINFEEIGRDYRFSNAVDYVDGFAFLG